MVVVERPPGRLARAAHEGGRIALLLSGPSRWPGATSSRAGGAEALADLTARIRDADGWDEL